MECIHASWERKNLGVDSYEILLSPTDTVPAIIEEEKRVVAQGARYIVLKTPVNCPHLLFTLPTLGYTFVEMVFHVCIKRNQYHIREDVARFDRGLTVHAITEEADSARISQRIAQGIFVSDRVSVDPAFSLALSSQRYINWIHTMRQGGATLYEVRLKEKPIGFFVIERKSPTTVDPVLMGLYDAQNDRGLGALLHKKTLDTCFTYDCTQLTSTVVSNNAKVLRIYVHAGATLSDTLYTYVKHI